MNNSTCIGQYDFSSVNLIIFVHFKEHIFLIYIPNIYIPHIYIHIYFNTIPDILKGSFLYKNKASQAHLEIFLIQY